MRISGLAGVIGRAAAIFFCAGSLAAQAGHPLETLQATTDRIKPGEWTLLPNSTLPWGTIGDKASAAYDFRRHSWYFAEPGGNPLFYDFEGLRWNRRQATAPVIGSQYDGVVWHDGRNSGLWLNGTSASEYAEGTGWKAPIALTPANASAAPVSFYRLKSNSAIVIPLTASQGPFEITTAGAVARRSSAAWKTSGSGVGAYDWIRDQAYIFHNDGSGTAFYVVSSASLSANPIGAPALAATQPPELTGASGIGHKCGTLFVDDYDMLFVWCGGRAVWTYEPRVATPRWTKYDTGSAIPTAGPDVAINNRLIYLSELRVFAGLGNAGEGIWLYKFLSEPEPDGTAVTGCSSIRGPCTELNNPGVLTAWQGVSVPASGGTVVVMANHQVNGAKALTSDSGWFKVVGKGRMTNSACLAVPPKPSCDRPRMYQTAAQHSSAGWLNAQAGGPAVAGGPVTVQHLHVDHFAGICYVGGRGAYGRHRQMAQFVDSEIDHCSDTPIKISADNRSDFPDRPPNAKTILDRVQLHHSGGEHNIYCGVTGLCQVRRSASYSPSGGASGSGATIALKLEGTWTDVEDNLLTAGDLQGDTDCRDVGVGVDWTLGASSQGKCRGNSAVVDGAACSRGIFRGNDIRTTFRGGVNNNLTKLCGTWVNTSGNIWRMYDVAWGKANQGQTLGAGQRKTARNWLAAQGDWYYDQAAYTIEMYSVGSPATVYGACATTTLTMSPALQTQGVYATTWQNRGSISGCNQGSYKPMIGSPVANVSGVPDPAYSIADISFVWGGSVMAPDTGNLYWSDVAAGGLATDEQVASNPRMLNMFVYGNRFTCRNCAIWHNGGGTSLLPVGNVWVNEGSLPGEKYLNASQSGPLTYKRWYCNLNPTDGDCTYTEDYTGIVNPDPLPTGYVERSRNWHVGNCLTNYPAAMTWEPRVAFVFGGAGPTTWGFGGIPQFDAPRVIAAGADTCPAGSVTPPAWFITSFEDPRMFWLRSYWGTRSGEYGYLGGSSAH